MNLEREPFDLEHEVKGLLALGEHAEAATRTIRALGPTVLSYLRRMLHDEDDVADAFSEWSERVWRGLPSFEFRSSLRTWCVRLAVNVALNDRDEAWRRRVRRFASGEASALAQSIRTSSDSRRNKLRELSRELDMDERTLLFLRVDQEMSWSEVAEILSASGEVVEAGTASKRFERLKAKIQKLARRHRLGD